MTLLVAIFLTVGSFQQSAPADSISLQYCYEKATENYPTAQNIELQEKINELNVRIANTAYYPQINVTGKVSYQSEVTEFSLLGGGGPPKVSKDQYEASFNVTQNIFNGGAVGIRKKLEKAKGVQQVESIKVKLHQIRSQIDQVYFGILLSQQQQKTSGLFIEDLQKRLKVVKSQVENGVLLSSQQRILEAELIQARQDSASIASNVRAGYQVLSEIVGEEIDTSRKLVLPKISTNLRSVQPQRPELDLFKNTRNTIGQQMKLAGTQKLPQLSAFGMAAYGRPGLNFLNDDFHDYYIVGLRLRWDFWDLINADREQKLLQIQQDQVTQNQRVFTKQLDATLDRIREDISVIRENIERDKKIIKLREKIVEESASQLKNGVITATEYVTELTHARQAQLSLLTNRVRLTQTQIQYATALGISIEKLFKN